MERFSQRSAADGASARSAPASSAAGEPAAASPAARAPARSPMPRWAIWWATLKLGCFALGNLIFMNYRALIRPRYGWLRRTGRADEVEASVERLALYWSRACFSGMGCRVEVEGMELVPREGPLVVMPNHQSLFDIPLLMGWLGRPVGFVFKRELLRIPGLRYWMLQIHGYPVDRGEHREAAEQYDRWGDDIKAKGRALVLFPEGTRSRDAEGSIGPFRRGVLRLAGPRGIPVLPVVIDGTRHLVRPERLARTPPGRRLVRMRILPPRVTEPMGAPEAKQFMEALRQAIVSARESLRVDWN